MSISVSGRPSLAASSLSGRLDLRQEGGEDVSRSWTQIWYYIGGKQNISYLFLAPHRNKMSLFKQDWNKRDMTGGQIDKQSWHDWNKRIQSWCIFLFSQFDYCFRCRPKSSQCNRVLGLSLARKLVINIIYLVILLVIIIITLLVSSFIRFSWPRHGRTPPSR